MESPHSASQDTTCYRMQAEVPLSGPIEAKIAWAEHCHREWGHRLLKDAGTAALLGRLEKAISLSREEMAATGIVDICRGCEEVGGGSCCGAGLENRYDARLLLINLLLGVELY